MSANGKDEKSEGFWVNGIVSNRDQQPYIQLSNSKGMIAQFSMNEARQVAMDILIMASRTEMDAMVFRFIRTLDPQEPEKMAGAMMQEFREYRAEYDREQIERGPDQEGGLPPRQPA